MSSAPDEPQVAQPGGAGRAFDLKRIAVSGVSYAASFLVTTVLHELAHYVVALGWGRDPTLFHNSVQSALEVSNTARVTTSLAGPIFSLLQGVLLLPLERRLRKASPELRLFVVWLAFHGLMNATGYLFTTAFVPDADMGSAARRLEIPFWGMLAMSGLGFWSIRVAAHWIYPGFVALLPSNARTDVSARNRGLVGLALFAWPIGVLLVLPASLPVPHWLSLMYVLIAGVGSVWFTDFSKADAKAGKSPVSDTETSTPDGLNVALPALNAGLWVVLTLLCLLVLRHGVHLG
ncbi:MAG: hypothetical protein H6718_24190 [Polyangiaceae bacterium]|nr:hypothetical protein [Myxococcales bacterium]MCB9588531.1 hypothetical protein [Polyangiaceae bacterium]